MPSLTSLISVDVVTVNEDDEDDNDDISFNADNSSFHRLKQEYSSRERIGEYCVSVFCTAAVGLALLLCVVIAVVGVLKLVIAILYWDHCPANASLPVFILVSGLSPTLFYVACRTRRKERGKVPGTQRIVGRWHFSAFRYTLDTERSWQAGLAGLLCFFLLCWLVYGTVLTAQTRHQVDQKPDDCRIPVPLRSRHGNATSPRLSSSSLISSLPAERESGKNYSLPKTESLDGGSDRKKDSLSKTEAPTPSSSISSLALLSSSVSSSVASTTAPLQLPSYSSLSSSSSSSSALSSILLSTKNNATPNYERVSPVNFVTMITPTYLFSRAHHDITRKAGSNDVSGDVNMTSSERAECAGCDPSFLTWCLSLVLFDWAYLVILTLNLLVVGTVPCCCYIGVDDLPFQDTDDCYV